MILVTGGTGLVGSHLLLDLSRKGYSVRAMRRSESSLHVPERVFKEEPELWKKIEWVEGDVTDVYSILEALKDVDQVYHAAALISFSPSDRERMEKINVEGTANMVNMCLESGVKRFCHISSISAIGRSDEGEKITEKTPWKTSPYNSNYAISKYGAEREVWRGVEEGLSAVIVNPTIIIGAGNWDSGSAKMVQQVWDGLSFYTKGKTGFVDVRDVSAISVDLMEKGVEAQRYILNSECISYREVFDTIADGLGKKKPSIYATPFLGELAWRGFALLSFFLWKRPLITKETVRNGHRSWEYSNDKIKKELNYTFRPVKDSIADVCRIFLEEKEKS